MKRTVKVGAALAAALMVSGCGAPGDAEQPVTKAQAATVALGFDDLASGTAVDTRYPGVTFREALHGGSVFAVTLDPEQGNGVSIWSPVGRAGVYSQAFAAEEGAVDATFAQAQKAVSIDARAVMALEYLGSPQKRPFLQAFDAGGQYLGTTYYDVARFGVWQTLAFSRPTADIARVRFSSQNNWAGTSCTAPGQYGCASRAYGGIYGTFDNLRFDSGNGAAPGYQGCYVDGADRALPIRLIDSGATVESCVAAAEARGLPYAGLQWYGTCFGGYAVGYGKAPESDCSTPCAARPSQTCGGAWRNSVYATNAVLPTPAPSALQGCFSDGQARALPAQLLSSGATVESCVAAARDAGFRYAGLQWYGSCFAGDAPAFARVADAECNTPCSANHTETCGGAWRNSIHATGATRPTGAAPRYLGCYTDDANRALPARLIASGATLESCVGAARARGYAYAGLQWYGACYAGNAPGYARVADAECALPCTANPAQICGGSWRTSLYATGP